MLLYLKQRFSPRIGGRKWYGLPFTQRAMSMEKDTVILLSPQWGSNSKVEARAHHGVVEDVSVPAMGKQF